MQFKTPLIKHSEITQNTGVPVRVFLKTKGQQTAFSESSPLKQAQLFLGIGVEIGVGGTGGRF